VEEQAEKIEHGPEQVVARLRELERRVAVLEKREESQASATPETFLGGIPKEKDKRVRSTSVVPVLDKAVLAIAGAYLVRANAESGPYRAG
jgi:hypothetical protein